MSHRLPLADIQFIADFAAYARQRDGDGFRYSSAGNCACAQFLRDTGRAARPNVSPEEWHEVGFPENSNPLPKGMSTALLLCDETFADLAPRLEALIADAPTVRQS
jgi:hypothetical protein